MGAGARGPRHTATTAATSPPGPGPAIAALQRQVSDLRLRELIRSLRQEALQVEDLIPWNSVRRTWRNKRTNWRRQVKCGELVPEMAMRLKVRAALGAARRANCEVLVGKESAGCGRKHSRVQVLCMRRGTELSGASIGISTTAALGYDCVTARAGEDVVVASARARVCRSCVRRF